MVLLSFSNSYTIEDIILKTCPKCQTQLLDNKKFCPNCGTNVEHINKCFSCGKELPIGVKYCVYCGKEQQAINTKSEFHDANSVEEEIISIPSKRRNCNRKMLSIICIFVVVCVLVGAFCLYTISNGHTDNSISSDTVNVDTTCYYNSSQAYREQIEKDSLGVLKTIENIKPESGKYFFVLEFIKDVKGRCAPRYNAKECPEGCEEYDDWESGGYEGIFNMEKGTVVYNGYHWWVEEVDSGWYSVHLCGGDEYTCYYPQSAMNVKKYEIAETLPFSIFDNYSLHFKGEKDAYIQLFRFINNGYNLYSENYETAEMSYKLIEDNSHLVSKRLYACKRYNNKEGNNLDFIGFNYGGEGLQLDNIVGYLWTKESDTYSGTLIDKSGNALSDLVLINDGVIEEDFYYIPSIKSIFCNGYWYKFDGISRISPANKKGDSNRNEKVIPQGTNTKQKADSKEEYVSQSSKEELKKLFSRYGENRKGFEASLQEFVNNYAKGYQVVSPYTDMGYYLGQMSDITDKIKRIDRKIAEPMEMQVEIYRNKMEELRRNTGGY